MQPTNKRLVTESSVGGHIATQINLPGTVRDTLDSNYVRFVDEAGNPLPSRNVVIKVDSTTGDILDIVSEV